MKAEALVKGGGIQRESLIFGMGWKGAKGGGFRVLLYIMSDRKSTLENRATHATTHAISLIVLIETSINSSSSLSALTERHISRCATILFSKRNSVALRNPSFSKSTPHPPRFLIFTPPSQHYSKIPIPIYVKNPSKTQMRHRDCFVE